MSRLPDSFSAINPGEIDQFALDFTVEIGAATFAQLNPTSWTCTLAPFQAVSDATPQSHILSVATQTAIQVRDQTDTVLTKTGFFSVALIGGFTAAMVGGTYVLEATLNTSDGRTLTLSSTVLCAAP